MRCIFIPHLGKIGLAYFSPSECEVAHASRGINGGSNQRARLGGGGVMGQSQIAAHLQGPGSSKCGCKFPPYCVEI